jgi:glycosyltransferase involved in cell wall biosynthesis
MNESLPLERGAVLQRLRQYQPDIVHFHDITTAFNVRTIDAVAARYPTVWTLHDQSAMTGGCITAHPCDRYLQGCGACPRFPNWCLNGRLDRTAQVQRQKRAFFRSGRGELTTPSRNAAQRLMGSGVLENRDHVHVVNNGLDMRTIEPLDQATARRWLGLPADRFIIVLIAHDLDDVLKNPPSQRAALRAVADLDPFIVVVGNTIGNPSATYAPNDVRNMGFVASDPLKNSIFAAADLFLNTSLDDTFSLTTLEAMAAGTPVVAYASGGIPELIMHEETGLLIDPDDGVALAAALRDLITTGRAAAWRAGARTRAETFDHARVLHEYLEVYDRSIERFPA